MRQPFSSNVGRREALAFVAACAVFAAGCTPRRRPSGPTIDDVELLAGEAPRVPPSRVLERIVTTETAHFPPFEWLSAAPVLGIFDALTVEYAEYDRATLDRDLQRIKRFYQARGFFEAEVSAVRVVTTGSNRVRIELVVREGAPVFIDRVEGPAAAVRFESGTAAEREAVVAVNTAIERVFEELRTSPLEDPPVCIGPSKRECTRRPRFDEDRYDTAKRAISRSLADAGYPRAKVSGRVEVDLAARSAAISFEIEPGPSCRFGALKIVGNGEISEALLRARLGFERGERYSAARLEAARTELAELGVFDSFEVRPELDGMPSDRAEVPITVSLQPSKLRSVMLGVGAQVGSQVEAHGTVGWEDRNLLGGLRTLSVELRPGVVLFPSRIDNLFSRAPSTLVPQAALLAAFRQPSFIERRTDLKLELSARAYAPQIAPAPDPVPEGYNIVGYYELQGAVGVDRRFRFRPKPASLLLAGSVRAQVDYPFSYNQSLLPPEYARVLIPYLDGLIAWDQRVDRAGRPSRIAHHRGSYAAFEAQFAFGDARDLRLQPEVRFYRPFGERLVVALRGTVGALFPLNYGGSLSGAALDACNHAVPAPPECSRDLQLLSFRAFYSGGPFSNRGYGFREVGPHGQLQFANQSGLVSEFLPTGGVGLWEVSAELRFALLDALSLVAFVDGSDVVRSLGELRLDHPHLAPGTGLRLATPVGPLRLDVGFRPPYLQRLGFAELEQDEGGPGAGAPASFPWAFSLAIGEAF